MKADFTLPGATHLDDISGLKLKHIRTREQLYQAEFENIANAIYKYLSHKPSRRVAPFTLRWIKKLHEEMFSDVWSWAGLIRRAAKNIGPQLTAHQIEVELTNMLKDLSAWQAHDMELIEQAARLHHRAVYIHPFENGNGRWARLLANIYMKQQSAPVTRWPDQDISGGCSIIREQYLEAVRSADNHDLDPLIELHKKYTLP